MKMIWKISAISAISISALLAFAFVAYSLNGGVLINTPLDLAMLSDDNPVRRELNIESCTTATVIVANLNDYDWAGVRAVFEDDPSIIVHVYLSKNDTAKLNVGDAITVMGKIHYTDLDNGVGNKYKHVITVGSSIAIFPYTFNARLVSVSS